MYCSTLEPCALGSCAATRSLLACMSLRHSAFTRLTTWVRLSTGPLAPPPPPQAARPTTTRSTALHRRTDPASRLRPMGGRYSRRVLPDYASYESGIGLDWYAVDPNLRALLDRLLPDPGDRAFAEDHVAEYGVLCGGPIAARAE